MRPTHTHLLTQVEERAIKRSGTKCKGAAMAVAGTHVITKTVKMAASLMKN